MLDGQIKIFTVTCHNFDNFVNRTCKINVKSFIVLTLYVSQDLPETQQLAKGK